MTEERGLTMEDRGRPGQALLEQHINRMVTLSPSAAILRSVRGSQHHRQRPADGQIENRASGVSESAYGLQILDIRAEMGLGRFQ